MRKHTTIDLDMELVRQAGTALGTVRTTDTVHAALSDVIRRRLRSTLLEIPNDLDLEMLDDIRAHRVTEKRASYASKLNRPRRR
jgi:Arc/MetJ family transcription regulator